MQSTDHTYLIISLKHNIVFCQFSDKVKVSIASALGKKSITNKNISTSSASELPGPALVLTSYLTGSELTKEFVTLKIDKERFAQDFQTIQETEQRYLSKIQKSKNAKEVNKIVALVVSHNVYSRVLSTLNFSQLFRKHHREIL